VKSFCARNLVFVEEIGGGMKKILFFILIGMSCFIVSSVSAQEAITITTYYPAPFGVYINLRLFPTGQPACNVNQEGTMYYDNVTNQVMVCTRDSGGNPAWQGLGLWTRNGNIIHAADINWDVGVGTSSPRAKLEIAGGLKIRMDNDACIPAKGGTMRYNNNNIEFCDGNRWSSVGGNFGGMYAGILWVCLSTNPYTHHCSCPAGYHSRGLWPFVYVNYCYK